MDLRKILGKAPCEAVEPAKVKALNYADPVFKGQGVWKTNGGKFGRDYVFTNNHSMEHLVEYKLSIRERHDQVNCGKVCVEDYMVLSQERKHWEKRIGEIAAWETKFFELIICDRIKKACYYWRMHGKEAR